MTRETDSFKHLLAIAISVWITVCKVNLVFVVGHLDVEAERVELLGASGLRDSLLRGVVADVGAATVPPVELGFCFFLAVHQGLHSVVVQAVWLN